MRQLGLWLVVCLMASLNAFANEGGHGGGHEGGANMNLLPQPTPNKEKGTRPSKVTLESPAALSKVSGGAVTLKWSESKGATAYHVQVATDPNFKWLVTNENFVKGNTFEVKGLEAGKQYFWRVAGMNPDHTTEYVRGDFVWSSFTAQ
jgi:hypothetical protein